MWVMFSNQLFVLNCIAVRKVFCKSVRFQCKSGCQRWVKLLTPCNCIWRKVCCMLKIICIESVTEVSVKVTYISNDARYLRSVKRMWPGKNNTNAILNLQKYDRNFTWETSINKMFWIISSNSYSLTTQLNSAYCVEKKLVFSPQLCCCTMRIIR